MPPWERGQSREWEPDVGGLYDTLSIISEAVTFMREQQKGSSPRGGPGFCYGFSQNNGCLLEMHNLSQINQCFTVFSSSFPCYKTGQTFKGYNCVLLILLCIFNWTPLVIRPRDSICCVWFRIWMSCCSDEARSHCHRAMNTAWWWSMQFAGHSAPGVMYDPRMAVHQSWQINAYVQWLWTEPARSYQHRSWHMARHVRFIITRLYSCPLLVFSFYFTSVLCVRLFYVFWHSKN